ncbi:MAG TPA: hypothetical protein VIL22_07835 [Paenibacillaceae bacterium]
MNGCERFRYVEPARGAHPGRDLTFKFFADGKLEIVDNATGSRLEPRDLKGGSYDFYVRQRISFIRRRLQESIARHGA